MAFARRWMAIPFIGFFDDIKITELVSNSCLAICSLLVDKFGWRFDPEKDSHPSTARPFLGIIEDFSEARTSGITQLRPRPEVEQAIHDTINGALATGTLQPHDAQSLRGKLIHLSNALEGRVGRGQTFACQSHVDGHPSGRLSSAMRNILK